MTAAPGGCSCLILSKEIFDKNLRKIKHKFYRNIYARDHEFDDLVRKGHKKSHERELHHLETHKKGAVKTKSLDKADGNLRAAAGTRFWADPSDTAGPGNEEEAEDAEHKAANGHSKRAVRTHKVKRAQSVAHLGIVRVDEVSRTDDYEEKVRISFYLFDTRGSSDMRHARYF